LDGEHHPGHGAFKKLAVILTFAIFSTLYELVTGKMVLEAAVDEEKIEFSIQEMQYSLGYDIIRYLGGLRY
jgi:hypothetical protein